MAISSFSQKISKSNQAADQLTTKTPHRKTDEAFFITVFQLFARTNFIRTGRILPCNLMLAPLAKIMRRALAFFRGFRTQRLSVLHRRAFSGRVRENIRFRLF